MCGIVGYIGKSIEIKEIVDKLKKLEYRGYDSAGIYGIGDIDDITLRSVGNISKLEQIIPNNYDVNLAIAHTRWATHGRPSVINCHPHTSSYGNWCIVHNGIIENYLTIKERLKNKPISDSDTAVISQLLEENQVCDIEKFIRTFDEIEGSYAIVAVNKNSQSLFLAKHKSPLYVAKINTGFVVASDPICFSDDAKTYYKFEDNEFAQVLDNKILFYDKNAKIIQKQQKNIKKVLKNDKKINYKHYMLKEIYEQSKVIKNLISVYKEKNVLTIFNDNFIQNIENVKFIGCGTAYHACMMGARYFEEIAGIRADAEMASEFVYKEPCFINEKTLVIAVSQSGETADTLKAVEIAKKYNAKILALTNVEYSSIVYMVDYVIPVCAGPEMAVASTKAYVCQLCALYVLAGFFAKILGKANIDYFSELNELSDLILNFDKNVIDRIANEIKDRRDVIFVGKGLDFITAQEASLKLKEVSYINSTSYPSGELKHGYLALVEDGTPVFVFATNKKTNLKTFNSAYEAQSRGAKNIIITNEEISEKNAKIIKFNYKNEYLLPILTIVPMQYLAYKVSILKNINPDQPRNLAKSVTVE